MVTATVNMRKYMRSRTRALMFIDADLETAFCLTDVKFTTWAKVLIDHVTHYILVNFFFGVARENFCDFYCTICDIDSKVW